MPTSKDDQKDKLLALVREAVEQDKALREKYQIGDKFRFIRERLQALLLRVEESFISHQNESKQAMIEVLPDEVCVYVYLYNAQGILFPSWQKMLHPSVFYEYSVNRPIYSEKPQVESFIRSKSNKMQHGYVVFAVKKDEIIQEGADIGKDTIGNKLIKVKEGALRANKFLSFTHNNIEYVINAEGELVKKE